MRQALWILRKDIRHLWPRIALFVGILTVYANGDAAAPYHPRFEGPGIVWSFLLWLAAAFLAISVVHEDRLVGDRQFWITRPYSWKSLLLAKGLFVLLLVSLPVLLAQIAALVSNSISPLDYVPELLWRQVTLAAWTILPCAALAAVTRNLPQTVIAAFIALFAAVFFTFSLGVGGAPEGAVSPADAASHAVLAMLLAGGACWLQFARRGPILARSLLVCGIVVAVTVFPILPWRVAFAWLEWRSPAIDAQVVRLAPDLPRKAGPGGAYVEKVPISFPIQVTGIPDGMAVYSERVKIALEAAGGKTWSSNWRHSDFVTDHRLTMLSLHQLLPGAGAPYWLVADVDRSFYEAFSTQPVHVRAAVAFTLLDRAQTKQLSAIGAAEPIADHGFCYPSAGGSGSALYCIAPMRGPALVLLRPPTGRTAEDEAEIGSGGGIGTVFSIWESIPIAGRVGLDPSHAVIETRQAVAHFERDLDMPGVVLAELRGQ